MKIQLCLAVGVLFFSMMSATWLPKYQGLITDDYGIVTLADLDVEGGQADPWMGFTGKDLPSYWQCLEPEDYSFSCENLGRSELEGWDIGEMTFWIKANGQTHHFWARHNWDTTHCDDMMMDVLWLMKNEPVVCIEGDYIEPDEQGTHWILDRVKTRKGAWSWFDHPGYNENLPSSFIHRDEDSSTENNH